MRKPLPGKADHPSTGKTEEVRVVSRTTGDVGPVGTETPGTVNSLHGMHQPGFFKQIERAVQGYPIMALELGQISQLRLGERVAFMDKRAQDLKTYGRYTNSCLRQQLIGIHD